MTNTKSEKEPMYIASKFDTVLIPIQSNLDYLVAPKSAQAIIDTFLDEEYLEDTKTQKIIKKIWLVRIALLVALLVWAILLTFAIMQYRANLDSYFYLFISLVLTLTPAIFLMYWQLGKGEEKLIKQLENLTTVETENEIWKQCKPLFTAPIDRKEALKIADKLHPRTRDNLWPTLDSTNPDDQAFNLRVLQALTKKQKQKR